MVALLEYIFFYKNCCIVIPICPQGFNQQKVNIGSGNGLLPNRQQAITWTNVDQDV